MVVLVRGVVEQGPEQEEESEEGEGEEELGVGVAERYAVVVGLA